MLAKTTRLNMLYDFYGVLLTEKQQRAMELYYREDLSLDEIANKTNVSRQTVYDTIKRTEQLLETYEEKLSLYKKFTRRRELLEQVKMNVAVDGAGQIVQDLIEEIRKLD